MLTLRVKGVTYDNFESASVTRSIEAASGTFQFTTSANRDEVLPVFAGDEVEILADGVLVLTGYIEKVDVRASVGAHSITVSGRDYTGDLIDSSMPAGLKDFTGSVTLVGVAEAVIEGLGLQDRISVRDDTRLLLPFNASEIEAATVGENAFKFIEKIAQKQQVLVSTVPESRGKSTLVFTRASLLLPSGISVINRVTGRDGSVKNISYSYDQSKLYGKYVVRSQLPAAFQGLGITPSNLSDQQSSEVTSLAARKERFLEITAKSSMDSTICEQRAVWEANNRLSQAEKYEVTFSGHQAPHRVPAGPWIPNLLVGIIDEFARLNGPKITKVVTLSYTKIGGSESVVSFAPRDAYSITKPSTAAKSGGLPEWVTPEMREQIASVVGTE